MFVAFGQNVSCSASQHACPVKDYGQFWQMSTILKKRYFVRSCWFYNSSWLYLISKEDSEGGSWNWERWWANSFAMRKAKTTPSFTITRSKPYTRIMKRITIPSISILSTWDESDIKNFPLVVSYEQNGHKEAQPSKLDLVATLFIIFTGTYSCTYKHKINKFMSYNKIIENGLEYMHQP